MRVAAVQMTSTPDKSANLAQARRLFDEACGEHGADLVAFPENFSVLTDNPEQFHREAETLKGVTVSTLQEWAAESDVWILGGSIPLRTPKDPKRVTNTSLLITSDGDIAARYDKIHLFDAQVRGDRSYRESKHVFPGKRAVSCETPWAVAGLSICYDLRFPELYRRLARASAGVLFIPSAFTAVTGKAHWDVLTRARAVENQCYVVAPAQTGSPYPGRETHGHTRIIDPWGRVIAERPKGPGVIRADLDFSELERIRRELPALRHRVL